MVSIKIQVFLRLRNCCDRLKFGSVSRSNFCCFILIFFLLLFLSRCSENNRIVHKTTSTQVILVWHKILLLLWSVRLLLWRFWRYSLLFQKMISFLVSLCCVFWHKIIVTTSLTLFVYFLKTFFNNFRFWVGLLKYFMLKPVFLNKNGWFWNWRVFFKPLQQGYFSCFSSSSNWILSIVTCGP